jgi:hypothetical protein
VTPVFEDMTLLDFAEVLKTSHRNHFPVLRSGSDEFSGMLELGPIREILLDPELARVTLVGTMMDTETPTIPLDASLAEALNVFEQTGAWALPVVDGRRFAGLLSKSSLFDHYRRELSVQGFARAGTTTQAPEGRAQRANGERSGVARASPGPGPQRKRPKGARSEPTASGAGWPGLRPGRDHKTRGCRLPASGGARS